MKLPRNLDGDVLAAHLTRRWNYALVRQAGSHARLQTMEPTPQSITVRMHRPLKPGTLASILEQIAGHKDVTVEQLLAGL